MCSLVEVIQCVVNCLQRQAGALPSPPTAASALRGEREKKTLFGNLFGETEYLPNAAEAVSIVWGMWEKANHEGKVACFGVFEVTYPHGAVSPACRVSINSATHLFNSLQFSASQHFLQSCKTSQTDPFSPSILVFFLVFRHLWGLGRSVPLVVFLLSFTECT